MDACPWGITGILEHSPTGTPLEFFAEKLNPDDANRFKVQIGDAAGQSYWEALSILCAIRAWGKFVKDRHVRLKIRTDNMAALRLAIKLSSKSPLLNGIGAEIALSLEPYNLEELVAEHVPGKLNVRADTLSRLWAPGGTGTIPDRQLQACQRAQATEEGRRLLRDVGLFSFGE